MASFRGGDSSRKLHDRSGEGNHGELRCSHVRGQHQHAWALAGEVSFLVCGVGKGGRVLPFSLQSLSYMMRGKCIRVVSTITLFKNCDQSREGSLQRNGQLWIGLFVSMLLFGLSMYDAHYCSVPRRSSVTQLFSFLHGAMVSNTSHERKACNRGFLRK